jgi:hypothetical protein
MKKDTSLYQKYTYNNNALRRWPWRNIVPSLVDYYNTFKMMLVYIQETVFLLLFSYKARAITIKRNLLMYSLTITFFLNPHRFILISSSVSSFQFNM